ncbi:MAG: helix-turn-helix transcriptional regulator [Chloroflexota bacterium]
MFQKNSYVKIVDPRGNYRFGYIAESKDRGSLFIIDLSEEGLNKINYENEFALIFGDAYANDFKTLITDTEKKILPLLAAQMSTKDIADNQKVSPVTIRAHLRDLKIKLQIETREQLVAYAQGICKKLKL